MWDALVNNPWILWLIVMLVLAAIEMLTLDFLFLMMSLAALVTAVQRRLVHTVLETVAVAVLE